MKYVGMFRWVLSRCSGELIQISLCYVQHGILILFPTFEETIGFLGDSVILVCARCEIYGLKRYLESFLFPSFK